MIKTFKLNKRKSLINLLFTTYSITKFFQLIFLLAKGIKQKQISSNLFKSIFLGFQMYSFRKETINYLFNEIFLNSNYFVSLKNKNPFIIDCGSNIGMSIFYFKWLYPKSYIVGFEAEPQTFRLLKKNIKFNKLLSDVKVFNFALSDKKETVTIYSNKLGSIIASTIKSRIPGGHNVTSVKVKSDLLTNFIKNNRVDLLKIDVECSEYKIFYDLFKANKLKNISNILAEFHVNHKNYHKMKSIEKELSKNGYEVCLSKSSESPLKTGYDDYFMKAFRKH